MSNYDKISNEELLRMYWSKIQDGTLTSEASYQRLHTLMERSKKDRINTPRIVKLIEQELKWRGQ